MLKYILRAGVAICGIFGIVVIAKDNPSNQEPIFLVAAITFVFIGGFGALRWLYGCPGGDSER
jgi:hypothetical protein